MSRHSGLYVLLHLTLNDQTATAIAEMPEEALVNGLLWAIYARITAWSDADHMPATIRTLNRLLAAYKSVGLVH